MAEARATIAVPCRRARALRRRGRRGGGYTEEATGVAVAALPQGFGDVDLVAVAALVVLAAAEAARHGVRVCRGCTRRKDTARRGRLEPRSCGRNS
eukprot:9488254-Pyramimonas_sp.AAC.1